MYVLIDTDDMTVKAKHPNFSHICEYGVLVCSESQFSFPLTRYDLLLHFTDVELQQIYINVTGSGSGAPYDKAMLAKVVHYYLNELPETILQDNVSDQAQYAIDAGLCGFWEYQLKGLVPRAVTQQVKALTMAKDTVAELRLTTGELVVTTNNGTQSPYKPKREAGEAAPRPSTGEPVRSRTSDVRDTVYATADDMWEAAGKPTGKAEVLKLRKQIMDKLETLDIKRNTSSNTLGKWQSERFSF